MMSDFSGTSVDVCMALCAVVCCDAFPNVLLYVSISCCLCCPVVCWSNGILFMCFALSFPHHFELCSSSHIKYIPVSCCKLVMLQLALGLFFSYIMIPYHFKCITQWLYGCGIRVLSDVVVNPRSTMTPQHQKLFTFSIVPYQLNLIVT